MERRWNRGWMLLDFAALLYFLALICLAYASEMINTLLHCRISEDWEYSWSTIKFLMNYNILNWSN